MMDERAMGFEIRTPAQPGKAFGEVDAAVSG